MECGARRSRLIRHQREREVRRSDEASYREPREGCELWVQTQSEGPGFESTVGKRFGFSHDPIGGKSKREESTSRCFGSPFLWELDRSEPTGNLGQLVRHKPPDFVVVDGLCLVVVRVSTVKAESGKRTPRQIGVGIPERATDGTARFAE